MTAPVKRTVAAKKTPSPATKTQVPATKTPPTAAKTRSAATKTAPTAKGRSAASEDLEGGYIRVYHGEDLRTRTQVLLGAIERAEEASAHRDDLAALVVELTNSGLDYCFIQPLKRAQPGFLVVQAANLGMVGAQQVMARLIRQVVGRMDSPQLLSVCGSIRQLMI